MGSPEVALGLLQMRQAAAGGTLGRGGEGRGWPGPSSALRKEAGGRGGGAPGAAGGKPVVPGAGPAPWEGPACEAGGSGSGTGRCAPPLSGEPCPRSGRPTIYREEEEGAAPAPSAMEGRRLAPSAGVASMAVCPPSLSLLVPWWLAPALAPVTTL